MKKRTRVIMMFLLTATLAACGSDDHAQAGEPQDEEQVARYDKETQAFLDDVGGIWYYQPMDIFLIIDDDMTATGFSAIELADSSEYSTHDFPDDAQTVFRPEQLVVGGDDWAYVIEGNAEQEEDSHYYAPSPTGTTLRTVVKPWGFEQPGTGSEYTYIGEVDDFEESAASIYEPDNRPYAEIDQAVYATLMKKKKEWGNADVWVFNYNNIWVNFVSNDSDIGTALGNVMENNATEEERELWRETAAYFVALMSESRSKGGTYPIAINVAPSESSVLEPVMEFDPTTGMLTDHLNGTTKNVDE